MELKPINLHRRQTKKNFFKRYKLILFIAAIVIALTLIWSLFSSSSSVFQFVFPLGSKLKSTSDRVNILLLGNAGGSHAGASLTDSIIIASYQLKTNKVTLISIPRDLWIEGAKAKVNTVYENGGLKYAEDKIDDILGLPIHYGVRMDFNGFAKAIDLVDGIDIDVPKTFDDYNYPIEGKEDDLCGLLEKEVELTEDQIKAFNLQPGGITLKPGKSKVLVDSQDKIATQAADFSCRFEHISFVKGKTHMDGTTALKFVRSRMGTNGEGSDFARSRRQQLVLQAFRNKVLSFETLINPQKITGLVDTFGKSFETDIELDRFLELYSLMKKIKQVNNLVLGDLGSGKSIFSSPSSSNYGGAYVLIPPDGDFKPVKDFIKSELDKQAADDSK
ncbi:LCP family protein [Candidatus Daviesbacteria bacterium]|nr:LCP family protein [Candidatus Daviesbacteria bacterium]